MEEECALEAPSDWLEPLRPSSRALVERMSGVLRELASDQRLSGSVVVRSHPLLVAVRRSAYQVLSYKPALPVEKALDILALEVKAGHLDEQLVRLFREARVWERLAEER